MIFVRHCFVTVRPCLCGRSCLSYLRTHRARRLKLGHVAIFGLLRPTDRIELSLSSRRPVEIPVFTIIVFSRRSTTSKDASEIIVAVAECSRWSTMCWRGVAITTRELLLGTCPESCVWGGIHAVVSKRDWNMAFELVEVRHRQGALLQ